MSSKRFFFDPNLPLLIKFCLRRSTKIKSLAMEQWSSSAEFAASLSALHKHSNTTRNEHAPTRKITPRGRPPSSAPLVIDDAYIKRLRRRFRAQERRCAKTSTRFPGPERGCCVFPQGCDHFEEHTSAAKSSEGNTTFWKFDGQFSPFDLSSAATTAQRTEDMDQPSHLPPDTASHHRWLLEFECEPLECRGSVFASAALMNTAPDVMQGLPCPDVQEGIWTWVDGPPRCLADTLDGEY